MKGIKFDIIIGAGLLLAVVLAFLLSIVFQLPKAEQVKQQAKTLPVIPRNLFANDNELTKKVRQLTTPTGVPVVVNPSTIGRGNVFENF